MQSALGARAEGLLCDDICFRVGNGIEAIECLSTFIASSVAERARLVCWLCCDCLVLCEGSGYCGLGQHSLRNAKHVPRRYDKLRVDHVEIFLLLDEQVRLRVPPALKAGASLPAICSCLNRGLIPLRKERRRVAKRSSPKQVGKTHVCAVLVRLLLFWRRARSRGEWSSCATRVVAAGRGIWDNA